MITPLDILSIESWVFLLTAIILFRIYLHKRWQFLKNLGVPHDSPSILDFGNVGPMFRNPDKFFTEDFIWKKKYGKIYGLYQWVTPKIVVWDTEILKHIFIKEFSTFPDRQKDFNKANGKEMNTNLTVVSGEQWKRLRHTLSPFFSGSKLKEMMSIMDVCADKMIANFRKIAEENDGRFDVKEEFGKFSMDVVCAAAFRINVNSQEGEESKEIKLAKKLFDNNAFLKNPFFWLMLIFPSFEKVFEALDMSLINKEVINHFKRLTDFLISKQSDSDHTKKVDFMKMMLDAEVSEDDVKKGVTKGMTRKEIVGNSIILILASYENVASTLLYLTYCITAYEGVQEKLCEELQECLERNDGKLTYEGINGMKYLDLCLKESMRLYTISPRNVRYCERDITIKDFTIPRGVMIDVPVHGLSHDEDLWDEPWEFKPERFEDMSKIDPMSYIPFGAGPRNCVGMRFAQFEVKVAICRLLQNFTFLLCEDTPAPPLELTIKGSVKPKKDVFLRVTPKTSS